MLPSFCKMLPLGELSEGYIGPFCIVFFNSLWIYNYLKIKQSPHPCAILLKAIRRERGIKRRKKSKSKIERMKLKPLSGTQPDISSYLATLAGKADLSLSWEGIKGQWSGSHFQRWRSNQLVSDHTPLSACSNPSNVVHWLLTMCEECTTLPCALWDYNMRQLHFMQRMFSPELMESKKNIDRMAGTSSYQVKKYCLVAIE